MKKKYISLFLALVMIIGLAVPTTLASSTLYDNLMATHDVADFMGVYQTAATADLQALTTEDITDVVNHLKGIYEDAPAMIANRDAMVSELLHLPNAPEQCSECGALGGHTGGCSLAPTPEPTQEPTPTPEAELPPEAEVDVTSEPEDALEPEIPSEPVPTTYETLMAATDLETLYNDLFTIIGADQEQLYTLTAEELATLTARTEEFYAAIETPTDMDEESYSMLMEMWGIAAICPDCGEVDGRHTEDCPRWLATTLATQVYLKSTGKYYATIASALEAAVAGDEIIVKETTKETANLNIKKNLTITLEADVHLDSRIYIYDGVNATIRGANGKQHTIKATKSGDSEAGTLAMIFIGSSDATADKHGSLTMNSVIIDGGAVWNSDKNSQVDRGITNTSKIYRALILGRPFAYLSAAGCTFQNSHVNEGYSGYNADSGNPKNSYAVMRFYGNSSVSFTHSIIQDCQQANENNNGMLRFTDVGTDTQVTMKNCKILRNRACHGVLRTASKNVVTMTISDSEFQHNHSTGGWGVVLWNSQEGSCNISNTTFNHNRSENRGGAISSEAKDLTLTGCTFTNNSAGEYGGAIAVFSYQSANNPDGADYNINVTIDSGCVFEGNTAPKGGAIAFDITKSAYADEGDKTRFKLKVDIQAGTGWFTNNTATQYGGAVWIKRDDENSTGVLNVKSGTISDNSATKDGGAIYVNGGDVNILGGTIISNTAIANGGGIAVNGGNVVMSGGTIGGATENANKAVNGGGLYINGGDMTMSGGTVQGNTASANGGGAYVTGGSMTMTGGNITNNTATTNGGGVAIDGGGFTMISGTLTGNKATGSASLGGGAYTKGGSVIIGVENCSGAGEKHSITHTGLAHPTVSGNNAGFGGGGLAAEGGNVTLYCGTVNNNTALSKGTGHNVFMNSGSDGVLTHHLDSTAVGAETDHDIVQIGGELNVVSSELGNALTNVKYYSNYGTTENPHGDEWPAETPKGYWVNLPYCPLEWEAYQNTKGLTFVGWTTTPSNPIGDCSGVRDKGDYDFIGEPVEIKEGLRFYAVWAPRTNNLTFDSAMLNYSTEGPYIASPIPTDLASYVDGETLTGISSGSTYTYNALAVSGKLELNKPNIPGYDFLGWVLKADTTVISNWNSDNTTTHPSSVYLLSATGAQTDNAGNSWNYDSNGKLTIDMNYNFGHLTFVGLFKEQPVTFTYEAVGPEGKSYGSLAPHTAGDVFSYTETIGAATGTATAITATPAYGYKFEGWHTDEECNTDVGAGLLSGEGEFKPTIKPKKNADGIYESGTFYALFDFHLADLYITKTATGSRANEQKYLFKLYETNSDTGAETYLTTVVIPNNGTVVINDLFIGTTYKVVESTDWSWRHDPADPTGESKDPGTQTIEIVSNAEDEDINKLTFANDQRRDYWLTSDDYKLNVFGMADT